MKKKYVYYDFVDVYDDDVFTRDKANEWRDYIVKAYESVYTEMKSKLDLSVPVQFSVNKSLLEESIIDAIIGMRKIVDSKNNSVEDPNSFKVISYLTYWWLRHMPISVHYPSYYDIRNIVLNRNPNEDEALYEKRRLNTIWQLKHMNELVAVHMVLHYIFDFDTVVCDDKCCKRVNKANNGDLCFTSFYDMYEVIQKKLTYYFSYRALAPKVIEHFLEAYTFHPAWRLTGKHWNLESDEEDTTS